MEGYNPEPEGSVRPDKSTPAPPNINDKKVEKTFIRFWLNKEDKEKIIKALNEGVWSDFCVFGCKEETKETVGIFVDGMQLIHKENPLAEMYYTKEEKC